jgi:hypothetical protein
VVLLFCLQFCVFFLCLVVQRFPVVGPLLLSLTLMMAFD